ncbi:MAG: hypothetical protein KKH88_00045 [Nanoarchaeota archaeon]|nr:hypothetical protein [Nanoarchaeota archaeon]
MEDKEFFNKIRKAVKRADTISFFWLLLIFVGYFLSLDLSLKLIEATGLFSLGVGTYLLAQNFVINYDTIFFMSSQRLDQRHHIANYYIKGRKFTLVGVVLAVFGLYLPRVVALYDHFYLKLLFLFFAIVSFYGLRISLNQLNTK